MTYVTVTYNAADVLQRTLDSVLCQDYPKITHMIIDGASTDATLQMVEAYIERSNAANNGHRIQVISAGWQIYLFPECRRFPSRFRHRESHRGKS